MQKTTKAEAISRQKANHYAWLVMLGADRDQAQRGTTWRKLRAIERRLDKVNTLACNGALEYDEVMDSYPDQDHAENLAKLKIISIFGKLPEGFEINRDPRGYALKINDEVMRRNFSNSNIAYQDWGGYGILAPSFQ